MLGMVYVFARLRRLVHDSEFVAEYRYNGLGHRIGWHYDVTDDGTNNQPDGVVDGNDPWYYFVYDDGWRVIATYRGSDSDPKERFFYHAAGLNGFGGSSYIDATILRDRDDNTAWYAAADGTMEQRRYYFQNWRGDVAAVLTDTGNMDEWVKYSAYGVPFGLPAGDTDSDGDFDSTDATNIIASGYDVRKDVELDGDNDFNDANSATAETLAYGVLSGIDSRKGYAGYEQAVELAGAKYHVRYRFFMADLGQWSRRDPLGYLDGMSLYNYVQGMAVIALDPYGLEAVYYPYSVPGAPPNLPCSGVCGTPNPGPGQSYPGPGPDTCVGGTCSPPIDPGPTGPGGPDPMTCMGGSCDVPTEGWPELDECGNLPTDPSPEPDSPWAGTVSTTVDDDVRDFLIDVTILLQLECGRGLVSMKVANELAKKAKKRAKQLYPNDGLHHGNGDAFRHCYWNCLMTRNSWIGECAAEVIATARENYGDKKGQLRKHRGMDIHNNMVGRRFGRGKPKPSQKTCENRCTAAVTSGELITDV